MSKISTQIEPFAAFATDNPSVKWFAIADSAQNNSLLKALTKFSFRAQCLFSVEINNPVGNVAPHLIEIPSPLEGNKAWHWISKHAVETPCLSVIAANAEFDLLYLGLTKNLNAVLPDGEGMWLAFWDPAILGSLIGQSDDNTLHINGPVLQKNQINFLLQNVDRWWYWDRNGDIHEIVPEKSSAEMDCRSIVLTQHQVDELVEASVPDHVHYYLQTNQRNLISEMPSADRYDFIRAALARGRGLGLSGMRDLVNYVCIELIYKKSFQNDVRIQKILSKVKTREFSLDDAIARFF